MRNIFIKSKNEPIELVSKDDLALTIDLLKKAKWDHHTVNGSTLIPNKQRLGTQWIKLDSTNDIDVKFTPSKEQPRADIVGVTDLQHDKANSDEGWHKESFKVDLNVSKNSGVVHPTTRYAMVILENPTGTDEITCSIQVTQSVNVVDYIKSNFETLKSQIGGVTSHLPAYWHRALATSTRLEVA